MRYQKKQYVSKKQARELLANLDSIPLHKDFKQNKISSKTYEETQDFYDSQEWKSCREEFLMDKKKYCRGCGLDLYIHSEMLNVDHIKPLKYHWENRIDQNNLQILCEDCNKEKGNQIIEDITSIGKIVKDRRKDIKFRNQRNQIREEVRDEFIDEWRLEWASLPKEHKNAALPFDKFLNMKINDTIQKRRNESKKSS